MDNCHITGKEGHAGSTFFGIALDPAVIPVLFKSLAAKIGICHTRTKLCPFCEETLREEAAACRFCNRILKKHIHFNIHRND